MTNKFFRVFLGIVVTAMFASVASANVLVNPGFESPGFAGAEVQGSGDGWSDFGGVFRIQGSPPIGPAGAHGGDAVLKVFGTAGVFQDFAANEGETWNGGAWVLNDSFDVMAGGQVAAVNIEWLDINGNQISFISNGDVTAASPVDTWMLSTVTGVAPAGTAFARFVLITGDFLPGGAGGAPRYDDAFFERVVIPIPGAVWLLGSGLLGLMGVRRNRA